MALPDAGAGRAEVLVATTWECNLRCDYCFVCKHTRGGACSRMSAAAAACLIDALDAGLRDAESICVHLYGGEPLLRLDPIRAMVERADTKSAGRFHFAITTNGTVATDEAIDLLGAGRFQVVLSIDGPPEVHNRCRRTAAGHPTHYRVLQFLEKLRARTQCWVRGSAVVRSGWNLTEAAQYLQTLPVDTIKAQVVRVPVDHRYALTVAERQLYLDALEIIGDQVIADLEAGRVPRDDRYSSRVLQLLKGESRERFCGAGRNVFGITPEGEIRPCLLIDERAIGRIEDDPQVWRREGECWRRARGPRLECQHCEALDLCGGGCPAMLPICGAEECDVVRQSCRVARRIYHRFRDRPEAMLALAGVV